MTNLKSLGENFKYHFTHCQLKGKRLPVSKPKLSERGNSPMAERPGQGGCDRQFQLPRLAEAEAGRAGGGAGARRAATAEAPGPAGGGSPLPAC